MLALEAIPALNDNYIWLLHREGQALVVDPGDSSVVLSALQQRSLKLEAILLTHHHQDHTAGAGELRNLTGARIFGPATLEHPRVDQPLSGGEQIQLLDSRFRVQATPGHTLDHLCFYSADAMPNPLLLCGDALFSAGCGRLFEGTGAQLLAAMQWFAQLPQSTLICCAHEYTLSNLAFAAAVEPDNAAITAHRSHCEALRRQHKATLPSTLTLEQSINPFLRYHRPEVCNSAEEFQGQRLDTELAVITALRQWKDQF